MVYGSRIPEKNLNLKESEPDFKQTNKKQRNKQKNSQAEIFIICENWALYFEQLMANP